MVLSFPTQTTGAAVFPPKTTGVVVFPLPNTSAAVLPPTNVATLAVSTQKTISFTDFKQGRPPYFPAIIRSQKTLYTAKIIIDF